MLPPRKSIELSLLLAMVNRGGSISTQDAYDSLANGFKLSSADLLETMEDGRSKWQNEVRWAKKTLLNREHLQSGRQKGDWVITEAGRKYLQSRLQLPDQ